MFRNIDRRRHVNFVNALLDKVIDAGSGKQFW